MSMNLPLDAKMIAELVKMTLVQGGMDPGEAKTTAAANAAGARYAMLNGLNGKSGLTAIREFARTLL